MKTPDLKPCPFCGCEAEIKRHTDIASGFYVVCTNCPTDVGRMWFWKRQDAVNAWNRRARDENA